MLDYAVEKTGEEKETRSLNAGSTGPGLVLLEFLIYMGVGFTLGALPIKEQERDEEEMWVWILSQCGGTSRGSGPVHSLIWKK